MSAFLEINFECQYVQMRMHSYLKGELNLESRRRIGKHLDECQTCRSHYEQTRAHTRDLEWNMGAFGLPNASRLDLLWSQINLQMNRVDHEQVHLFSPMRYGLASLALMFVLLLSMGLDQYRVSFSVPQHPSPVIFVVSLTPHRYSHKAYAVSVAETPSSQENFVASLRNTPEPLSIRDTQ